MDVSLWIGRFARKFLTRCFLFSQKLTTRFVSFATFAYGAAGQKLMDDLWDETMAELSFARLEKVLESLKH